MNENDFVLFLSLWSLRGLFARSCEIKSGRKGVKRWKIVELGIMRDFWELRKEMPGGFDHVAGGVIRQSFQRKLDSWLETFLFAELQSSVWMRMRHLCGVFRSPNETENFFISGQHDFCFYIFVLELFSFVYFRAYGTRNKFNPALTLKVFLFLGPILSNTLAGPKRHWFGLEISMKAWPKRRHWVKFQFTWTSRDSDFPINLDGKATPERSIISFETFAPSHCQQFRLSFTCGCDEAGSSRPSQV